MNGVATGRRESVISLSACRPFRLCGSSWPSLSQRACTTEAMAAAWSVGQSGGSSPDWVCYSSEKLASAPPSVGGTIIGSVVARICAPSE